MWFKPEASGDGGGGVAPISMPVPVCAETHDGPSILWTPASERREAGQVPDYFSDLNLDQVIDEVACSRQEYRLQPIYYAPLHEEEAVRFRQEVFRDLEEIPEVYDGVCLFAKRMRSLRKGLEISGKFSSPRQRQICFLEIVDGYGQTVETLARCLASAQPQSRGFAAFCEYLEGYLHSLRFRKLREEAHGLREALSRIRYCALIKGLAIRVSPFGGQADYSREVERIFAKFKQAPAQDYLSEFSFSAELNHIEAAVLDFVAQLNLSAFSALAAYCASCGDFFDPVIARFEREVQFYCAYLEYLRPLRHAGLPFCYPAVSSASREISSKEGFDLALAKKLSRQHLPVVRNDFYLRGRERFFIVSGPNQGGKTTFARTFGQLHYLASLGCPVPGAEATLFLCDALFTHFEREEKIEDLQGKLQNDLMRIHRILEQATPRSIVILNEIFTSTTLQDATCLSKKILQRFVEMEGLGVWVTFVDELARMGEQMVSMLSAVAPDCPAMRTFKIERRPADGRAYAMSIAARYGLTRESLRERIKI